MLFQLLGVYLGVDFNTPSYEHQEKHHLFIGKPQEERSTNRGECPYPYACCFDSHRIEFTTGYRIDVAKWDADKQRVKNGCTNKLKQSASEINADLLKYYTEIQNIFKEFEVQGFMPTTEQVKDAFNRLHNEKRKMGNRLRWYFCLWRYLTNSSRSAARKTAGLMPPMRNLPQ